MCWILEMLRRLQVSSAIRQTEEAIAVMRWEIEWRKQAARVRRALAEVQP